MKRKMVEILAPAGSLMSLKAAVCAGADAVYIGGSLFGARAYAENPGEEELLRAIDYVHLHGRKIYLTVNTLLKDQEMEKLYDYLLPYYKQGLDAVIVQDVGVMQFVKRNFPGMSLHISTQATVTNALGAAFFGRLGADRIVPARELSLKEVKDMKEKTGLETECFVHGAMCYCYSGQCLLSSMIGGRSGNRGQCAQPCRLPYAVDVRKPGDFLSLKDLCMIDGIPDLIEAGIDSFKIEGRMKQPEYVYTVVSMYRKYTDLYYAMGRKGFTVEEKDRQNLMNVYTRRGYSSGYYYRQNGREMISLKRPAEKPERPVENTDYKIKEKINGILILSEGKHATLSLEYTGKEETIYAKAAGETVQTALKAPLDKERADRQLRKTGNTDFMFDSLEIRIEGSTFLPMQSLNELRREGILKLTEEILSRHRRSAGEKLPFARTCTGWEKKASGLEIKLCVSVQSYAQLLKVLEGCFLHTIYIEGNIAFDREVLETVQRAREKGSIGFYAVMPYIFREKAISYYEAVYDKLLECYDGVLIRNWESFEWLRIKNYGKGIISDRNLYVFNKEGKDFMRQMGFEDYTFPAELNFRELKGLSGGGELVVYGYEPVMISANCLKKTTGCCKGEDGLTWLTDRHQKKFAVKNFCKYCYNVMYNCAPLMLADMAEKTEALMPSALRLSFTIEPPETVQEILKLYEKAFIEGDEAVLPETEYTRGHFKRGVK